MEKKNAILNNIDSRTRFSVGIGSVLIFIGGVLLVGIGQFQHIQTVLDHKADKKDAADRWTGENQRLFQRWAEAEHERLEALRDCGR